MTDDPATLRAPDARGGERGRVRAMRLPDEKRKPIQTAVESTDGGPLRPSLAGMKPRPTRGNPSAACR
jgi:hypothetical protein